METKLHYAIGTFRKSVSLCRSRPVMIKPSPHSTPLIAWELMGGPFFPISETPTDISITLTKTMLNHLHVRKRVWTSRKKKNLKRLLGDHSFKSPGTTVLCSHRTKYVQDKWDVSLNVTRNAHNTRWWFGFSWSYIYDCRFCVDAEDSMVEIYQVQTVPCYTKKIQRTSNKGYTSFALESSYRTIPIRTSQTTNPIRAIDAVRPTMIARVPSIGYSQSTVQYCTYTSTFYRDGVTCRTVRAWNGHVQHVSVLLRPARTVLYTVQYDRF